MKRAARQTPTGAVVALIAVQLIFGTWGIPGKIVLRSITIFQLAAVRVAGAAVALAVLGIARGSLRRIARRDWPLLIACALLGVVFNQWFFLGGLSLTTVINTVLISTTIPIFTLLISATARTERASPRQLFGVLLSAAGVVWLVAPTRADLSAGSRVGDLLILGSGLTYGSYIAISKRLVRTYGALTTMTWIFIVAAIAAVPIGVVSTLRRSVPDVHFNFWAAIVYIVLVPTVLAYFLNAWALARVPPSTVAVYIYLQPLIIFAIAPVVLGETVGLRAVLSSLIIFGGVLIVTRIRPRAVSTFETETKLISTNKS